MAISIQYRDGVSRYVSKHITRDKQSQITQTVSRVCFARANFRHFSIYKTKHVTNCKLYLLYVQGNAKEVVFLLLLNGTPS